MAFSIRMAVNLIKLSIAADQPKEKRSLGDVKLRGASLISKSSVDLQGKGKKYAATGFVAANSVGDIVVAIGASAQPFFTKQGDWRDWVLSDFDTKRIKHPRWSKASSKQAYVHRGFWRAYDSVAQDVRKAVSKFLKETYAKPVRILVTGHGLGGAMATLAAEELTSWFPKNHVSVYTTAAPRVGDAAFCTQLEQAAKDSHHIVNKGDPVPLAPPIDESLQKKGKMYATPGTLHCLRGRGKLSNDLPEKATMNPSRHRAGAYLKAMEAVVEAKASKDGK